MRYMIFDLDNTLYPRETGFFRLIDQRINDYMRMKLGVDHNLVEDIRLKYLDEYGTTLGGLVVHHEVDPDEYLSFVHDVDLEGFLSANPELSRLLERIVVKKVIFTNGSSDHARRVLKFLGVDHYFSRIFDIRFMNYLAKPRSPVLPEGIGCFRGRGEGMLDNRRSGQKSTSCQEIGYDNCSNRRGRGCWCGFYN